MSSPAPSSGSDDPRIALLRRRRRRPARATGRCARRPSYSRRADSTSSAISRRTTCRRARLKVVVCDGFVGNIVLKLIEGLGRELSDHLRARLDGKLPADELDALAKEIYDLHERSRNARRRSLIRVVNGVSVVGHGAANADAILRALETAKLAVETSFVEKMNQQLEALE